MTQYNTTLSKEERLYEHTSNTRVHNIMLLLRKIGLENGEYNWFMFLTQGGIRPILNGISGRYFLDGKL